MSTSMGPIDLGPANPRISPLIKLSRWSLLIGGIFWGMHRYEIHSKTETELRAYNARMQPIWDSEQAVVKAKANRAELLYLAKETGVKVPANF
eukprot:maker-scaffold270_size230592-snap-gene-1.26 protein:Tk10974 transcript:maker-scaffold270_size230592-snap-gene-1.26-mRNA-1 annotation:"atp synthase e chain"